MSESNEKAMKQNFLYVLVNMVSQGSFVAPNGNQTPMNFKFEDGKLYIEEKTKKNQYKHSIDYTYLDEKEKSLKGWYLLETSARPKKTQYIIEVENAYYERNTTMEHSTKKNLSKESYCWIFLSCWRTINNVIT